MNKKANTVRLSKVFLKFASLNKALFNRCGITLMTIILRDSWGINKNTQPQSQTRRVAVADNFSVPVRRRKYEDFGVAGLKLTGTEFFKYKSALVNTFSWVNFKAPEFVIKHNESGNIYKIAIKSTQNKNADKRELYVVGMNSKKHLKLTTAEIAEMFDDLRPLTIGDPCHYHYESARTIVCDL